MTPRFTALGVAVRRASAMCWAVRMRFERANPADVNHRIDSKSPTIGNSS